MAALHARTRLAVALAAALACGGAPATPAPSQRSEVPALSFEESFVQQTGLRVALRLPEPTLHVGQDPQFTLRFENTGTKLLYLSPHVEPGFRLTTVEGAPVPPIISGITERAAPWRIRAADLIRLPPGPSWTVPVTPYNFSGDRFTAHAQHGFTKESGWVLLLPPGRYVARFDYISAPDYGAFYDPYEMPRDLWEGRVESEPVSFTVVTPTPAEKAGDRQRLGDSWLRSLLDVLELSGPRLVEEFITKPAARFDVLRTVRARQERVAPLLIRALDALPARERESIVYSSELSGLLTDEADCSVLRFLTGELPSSRGDVVSSFRPVFEKAASGCPEVRERLRSTVQDAAAPPYARSNAAALLGTFHNQSDVPLLIETIERPPAARSDPIPRGAAIGLARIGGQPAREALARAFADDRRNSVIGSELVNRLGEIAGPDAAAPLLAALSSTNPQIVIGALGALVRVQAASPRMVELLRHPNPTIRSYAARAVRANGLRDAQVPMRAALSDADENVQQQALFYLAERGDPSDLELFVNRLASPSQYVREAARAGIARIGTAETWPAVRKLLDTPAAGVRAGADSALAALAFVESFPQWTPAKWDEWYARHRGTTRVEWAREAVDGLRQSRLDEMKWRRSAFPYLADQGAEKFRNDFERAATSRRAGVRVEAARALAGVDRRRAAELLLREFDGRLIGACDAANRALGELVGRQRSVDCTDPTQRRRARGEWASDAARF